MPHGAMDAWCERKLIPVHCAGRFKRHVVLVGGLTDGLLFASYCQPLAQKLAAGSWSLVQPLLTSSHQGWGLASLDQDAAELHLLARHLKRHFHSEVGRSLGSAAKDQQDADTVIALLRGRPSSASGCCLWVQALCNKCSMMCTCLCSNRALWPMAAGHGDCGAQHWLPRCGAVCPAAPGRLRGSPTSGGSVASAGELLLAARSAVQLCALILFWRNAVKHLKSCNAACQACSEYYMGQADPVHSDCMR